MKVTFPHMGYLNIPVRNMLTNLGIDIVEAPPITKRTVELGSLHSPEGVCLPYKINMGNFLEGLEQGADTVLTVCGAGKCRLGFYNAVQKIALAKKQQAAVPIYTINTSTNLFPQLYKFLRAASPQSGRLEIIRNIALGIKTLKAFDAVNDAKNFYGARAASPADIINMNNDAAATLGKCCSFKEINQARDVIIAKMQPKTGQNTASPVKVGLIGEFYLLLEPYVNHRVEDLLVSQGVEVKKFVYTGDWAYSRTLLEALGLYNEEKAYLADARPYLNYHVGGDGLKSVGSALWCARHGYDGIIHVYPFGCIPEVVAQYALKNVANDCNLPMLTLSVDEHSSDVGIVTRVEAFVDCLKRRQKSGTQPKIY